MAFKLIEAAEQRWRAVNAPHLVALVRAGVSVMKATLAGAAFVLALRLAGIRWKISLPILESR